MLKCDRRAPNTQEGWHSDVDFRLKHMIIGRGKIGAFFQKSKLWCKMYLSDVLKLLTVT